MPFQGRTSVNSYKITGKDVLCFAPRPWDSLWRETQYLMSLIAKDNRVVYIEPGKLVPKSGTPLRPAIRQVIENLFVVSGSLRVPIARRHLPTDVLQLTVPPITSLNNWFWHRLGAWAVKTLDIKQPILWLQNPYCDSLVGRFGEAVACYHNYDEFAEMPGNRRVRTMIWEYEVRLIRKVDVVFATSSAQVEKRLSYNQNCHLLCNAVDFELFNSAMQADLPPPEDMAGIRCGVIGFAGWLGDHIDVPLLLRIANEFHDKALVLVGPDELPVGRATRDLRRRKNVYFLGLKKRSELPRYLRMFKVALMPWRTDGHVKTAYPMKLNEYLAAGLSVISTDLREAHALQPLISVATTHDDFVGKVRSALLKEAELGKVAARIAVAQANSWQVRVNQIYSVLALFSRYSS